MLLMLLKPASCSKLSVELLHLVMRVTIFQTLVCSSLLQCLPVKGAMKLVKLSSTICLSIQVD
jgi:hypothetical protein